MFAGVSAWPFAVDLLAQIVVTIARRDDDDALAFIVHEFTYIFRCVVLTG